MTTGRSVRAVGSDRHWLERMRTLFGDRIDLHWGGVSDPATLRSTPGRGPAVWLIDGDDADAVDLAPRLHGPGRAFFYRHPGITELLCTLEAGGTACLPKGVPAQATLLVARSAGSGLFLTDAGLLLRATMHRPAQAIDHPDLTARQREVAFWASRGLSNKQIARELGISPETVKTHLRRACLREGVHGRIELAAHPRSSAAPPAGLRPQ